MPDQRMKVIARRWPVLGLSDATCGVPLLDSSGNDSVDCN